MIFKWETENERILKHMRIPPKKKLEWLYEMNQLISKTSLKRYRQIRKKLRAT